LPGATWHHAWAALIVWTETLPALSTVHHVWTWTILTRTHAEIIIKAHVSWAAAVISISPIMQMVSHSGANDTQEES
jgi:hypothetical protein